MTSFLSLESIRRHQIVNRGGDVLGHADDFIFDPQSGEIRYLVFSCGGVFGIGDKQVVVPFAEADLDFARERIILNFDVEDVKAAPGFTRGSLPDFAPAYRRDIDGFYSARRSRKVQ